MGAHVLLSLTVENSVKSKPERKVDSLPLLGLDPAILSYKSDESLFSFRTDVNQV
jgi:hypothetical protein